MVKCLSCGYENNDTATFCSGCGKELAAASVAMPTPPPQTGKASGKNQSRAGGCFLIVALLLLATLVWGLIGLGGYVAYNALASQPSQPTATPTKVRSMTPTKVPTSVPTGAPTLAAGSTPVPGATSVPAAVPTFASWGPAYAGKRELPATYVNSTTITVQAPGKYVAFTIDGLDLNTAFTSASVGSVNLPCQKVANPAEQLPTYVCKKADGSAISGMVTIKGVNFFQIWPQSSAPVPAGWTVSSVPAPVKVTSLNSGAVPAKQVVAAPLPSHLINLKPGMGVTKTQPVKGQMYCQATHVEFVPNNTNNDIKFAQGRTTLYVYVHDAAGNVLKNLPTIFKWADGQDPKTLEPRDMSDTYLSDHAAATGHSWLPNPQYTIDYGLYASAPAYSLQIGGVASDLVYGLGLDTANHHAANIVEFTCGVTK